MHALTWFHARLATPLGELCLVTDGADVLRALEWTACADRLAASLARRSPQVDLVETAADGPVAAALRAYFAGAVHAIDRLVVAPSGTPFQLRMWQALRAIPAGQRVSYGAFAAALGHPRAARAVGAANGANPISIVIPCHRLVGRDGTLTGYAGGLARKDWLLRHEARAAAVQAEAASGTGDAATAGA